MNKIPSINNKSAILNYLDKLSSRYQKIKNIKKNAEIFTPLNLINLMLDDLPVSVWSNENYRWFDMASGIGNFSIVIYFRLMTSLKIKFPNNSQRSRHILENMLYFSEINSVNVATINKVFNSTGIYKLNIHSGDTLELNSNELWNINKFNVIVCNPPYHKTNRKSTGGKGASLHFDFSKKAVDMISAKGYLLFIQPRNWRSIGSPVIKLYNDMTFIKLYLNHGRNYFVNAEVNTDYYLVYNSKTLVTTEIHYKYNRLNYVNNTRINKPRFIPNVYNIQIKGILHKLMTVGNNYKCVISSDCHKNQDHVGSIGKKFKYPLYNTSANPFTYGSSRPHVDQFKKKVILSNSGSLSPFYDDGVYGTTQDSMYILVDAKSEGNNIVAALNTKLFKFIIKICKWSNYRNEVKLISALRYPTVHVTNNTILRYYDISLDESEYLKTVY
jgi:hypothetical protein